MVDPETSDTSTDVSGPSSSDDQQAMRNSTFGPERPKTFAQAMLEKRDKRTFEKRTNDINALLVLLVARASAARIAGISGQGKSNLAARYVGQATSAPADQESVPVNEFLDAIIHEHVGATIRERVETTFEQALSNAVISPASKAQNKFGATQTSVVSHGRYEFVARDAIISSVTALSIWGIIVGMAAVTSRSWSSPLAIILGLAVLPFGLSGAIKRRA